MGTGAAPLHPTILAGNPRNARLCLIAQLGRWGKLAGLPPWMAKMQTPPPSGATLTFNPLALLMARSGRSTLRTLNIFTTEMALDLQEADCCVA